MKQLLVLFTAFCALSCQSQPNTQTAFEQAAAQADSTDISIEKYAARFPDNGKPSAASGSVHNGTLVNGKLMPFRGANFTYFDKLSYTNGRAFCHHAVRNATVAAYKQLETVAPGRHFCLMECSNQHGGKLFPHKTHQNGLSVDFAMPLLQAGKPYYALDSLGAGHYLLTFDNNGRYEADATVRIDFNMVATHILLLDAAARQHGLKISKVIINTNLKDELFATPKGKELNASGIYVVQSLTPLINALHDEHYHIDFEPL